VRIRPLTQEGVPGGGDATTATADQRAKEAPFLGPPFRYRPLWEVEMGEGG
jgi:hypothetical protein